MNNTHSSHALGLMRRERTCPPLSILRAGGAAVDAHLRGCPDCREKLENAGDYARMAEILEASIASGKTVLPASEESAPRPGDIRRLWPANDPDAWFDEDGTYHNPPLVLVLTEPDSMGQVQVAQMFDDPGIAAEGDVPLGRHGFAEAWNIYGLPVSGLSKKCCRRVGTDVAAGVLEAGEADFPDLEEGSPLFQFRLLERETGAFFSLPLGMAARKRREAENAGRPAARRISFDDARARMRDIMLGADWDAMADALPMAAADSASASGPADEHLRLPFLVIHAGDGAGHEAAPGGAADVFVRRLKGHIRCDILCRVDPALSAPSAGLSCAAEVFCGDAEAIREDLNARWEDRAEGTARIQAVIPGCDADLSRLRIALLLHAEA